MSKTSPSIIKDTDAAVSWGAILVGAVAAAGISVVLATLGVGTGLAMTSPWSDGASATTLKWVAGAYLVLTAIIASAIGGYMSGRLRTKWYDAPRQEVLFRDTAHGLASWAFATLLVVAVVGSSAATLLTSVAGGASQGAAQSGFQNAASANSGTGYFANMLLRPSAAAPTATAASTAPASGDNSAIRSEVGSIFSRSLAPGGSFSTDDRSYLSQIVAQRTGVSQADAEKRVDDAITQAKTYVDNARKYTVSFALWTTLALLAGAFAAAAAAIEGGQLRDGRWRGVIFAPREETKLR